MRSGDNAKLARWVDKKQLKMPVINDENGALSQAWQGLKLTLLNPTVTLEDIKILLSLVQRTAQEVLAK